LVEILSQAEIEALLASLTSDGDPVDPDPALAEPVPFTRSGAAPAPAAPRNEPRRTIAYEPYDFRRPDKFSKDQLRTLQMLHETFARLFASSLSAYLRVSTHVDLVSVEQVPYNEYMRSLTTSIINVISMEPLAGQAILEMEFNVVLAMIDRLLGGPGNMVKANTMLTEIEKALTESITQRALKDLRMAWDSVITLNPKRESMETQSQFIQIVPPNDTIVSILFEVKVGDLRGAMSLCIPYLLLKPITPKLSVQRWFSSTIGENMGQNADKLAQRLSKAKVTCVCRLGTARITVNDLVNLAVGDTVILDRRATDEVDLMIGSSVKFRGKPGTSGRKVALHVNRITAEDRF
jgi:flagellar motor switch protein FliM